MIKIVDNKKLLVTQDEWEYYEHLCRAYDRPNFKGEELFKNLFDVDDDGLITFIKPPSTSMTSMEVFLFVVGLYQHQHVRKMYHVLHGLMDEVRGELAGLKSTNTATTKK